MNVDEFADLAYRSLQDAEYRTALNNCEHALELVTGRPKLEARIHAWKAQALMGLHKYSEAQSAVLRGLSIARRCGDTQGVEPLRNLHRDIVARIVALQPPAQLDDTPLTRALSAFDRRDVDTGIRHAQEALAAAKATGSPRDLVLAYLALARAPEKASKAIYSAHEIAQQCGDMNLISAVARAAKAAEINLPTHVF